MAKTKVISAKEAAALVKDGMTVMVGGFMTNGTAESIIKEIAAAGAKDLTVICNDGGFQGIGTGRLLANGQIKKLIASHVGLNKEVAERMNNGTLECVLQPQGTLAEQIRAAGAGLGGVLTPTGVGTIVADGKETVTVDGKEYLLEKPLHADVAIIQGYKADETGNVRYLGSTRNFNTIMASAADTVIVEVEEIGPAGCIGPDYVETPHIYVDYLVKKED
ncbi:MAG: CoA transferase subunit A [Eubacterium sp.]|jgi:acetate CoA/acetoacetate CoA-transferase alpha subunit